MYVCIFKYDTIWKWPYFRISQKYDQPLALSADRIQGPSKIPQEANPRPSGSEIVTTTSLLYDLVVGNPQLVANPILRSILVANLGIPCHYV